jgi:hypothetical protein
MLAYLQFYNAWPSFFRGKSVWNRFMCRMIEWLTPRILLFHIEISRSFTFTFIFALNSENLHKSLNHCNSFNAAHYRKDFHSSTSLCASFDVVFIAIHHCVRAGKIAKDRRSRREFMRRHIVRSKIPIVAPWYLKFIHYYIILNGIKWTRS